MRVTSTTVSRVCVRRLTRIVHAISRPPAIEIALIAICIHSVGIDRLPSVASNRVTLLVSSDCVQLLYMVWFIAL